MNFIEAHRSKLACNFVTLCDDNGLLSPVKLNERDRRLNHRSAIYQTTLTVLLIKIKR